LIVSVMAFLQSDDADQVWDVLLTSSTRSSASSRTEPKRKAQPGGTKVVADISSMMAGPSIALVQRDVITRPNRAGDRGAVHGDLPRARRRPRPFAGGFPAWGFNRNAADQAYIDEFDPALAVAPPN
jgi:hypothetical protein